MELTDTQIDQMITNPQWQRVLQAWADAGGDTSGSTEEILARFVEETMGFD